MYRLPTLDDLDFVIDAAVRVDDAIGGCIQVVADEGEALVPLIQRGLNGQYVERFARVDGHMSTPCAQAWTERRRIVIRDVLTDAAFEPYRDEAARAGYRSIQSTPLVDSEFRSLGVLSTYFAQPHHPGSTSIALLDRLCRVASLVLETAQLHAAIVEADKRLSIPARALPGHVADAASTSRRQLAMLVPGSRPSSLDGIIANLDGVVRHLKAMIHQAHSFSVLSQPPAFS